MRFILYHVTEVHAQSWRCESIGLRTSLRTALLDIPAGARQIGRKFLWRHGDGYVKIDPVVQHWHPWVGPYLVTVDAGGRPVRYRIEMGARDLGA